MGGSCNFVPPPPSGDSCPGGVCPMKKKDKGEPLDKGTPLDTKCPNSDPGFNKIIGDRTPEERSNLYIVCVLVRTLLYSGVYVYRDEPFMAPLVGALALASMFQLYTSDSTESKQWWSKKFQMIMAVLVFLSALAVKFAGLDSRSMAGLLFISLAGGILQRTQIKMC
jgi:hypothetical protein